MENIAPSKSGIKHLDVTKAALLFGGRVLLVEGIAEALLLPVIAEQITLKGNHDKLRLFRSAVFVPIDGVDFSPYVKLLTSKLNGACITERVVVMTDGDQGAGQDDTADALENTVSSVDEMPNVPTPGEKRKKALEDIAKANDALDVLVAITSRYSLESELLEAGNDAILREAYLILHTRSDLKWDNAVKLTGDQRAKAIEAIFKDARKGDFAQVLAQLIESNPQTFKVPDYIKQTIDEVVA